MSAAPHTARAPTGALLLGVAAIAMFGLTLPMTRMATGTDAAPQLSPWFVTYGRAAVAGLLSLALLLARREPLPTAQQWRTLTIASLGNVIGYPLGIALALRSVTASHGAVITALLPLVTAAFAAWTFRQRASTGFWLCALLGTLLVIAYSVLRAGSGSSGFAISWADLLLVGAVLAASWGYVQGAVVTPSLGAERVICWVTVIALPITLPGTLLTWPDAGISNHAWLAFAYVCLFSMWIGLFAWYRALAAGGAVQISQLQLLQPFFTMLFAIPLLGERLDLLTLCFGAGVVLTVYLGRRMAAAPK